MSFGLIGNPLIHSISPQVHALLGLGDYALYPIKEREIPSFLTTGITGFNVTIPYKQTIIPYLAVLDETAREIGAVNTVVKRGEQLVGYNTDCGGMAYALNKAGIALNGKHVVILGTGGTSKTARFVAKTAGAKTVTVVGRKSEINYDNIYDVLGVDVIINTTPVGMFPHVDETPVDLDKFPNLSGVFDCIYNPKETLLVKKAKEKGIPSSGGILMLIEQARLAEELFLHQTLPQSLTENVAKKIEF